MAEKNPNTPYLETLAEAHDFFMSATLMCDAGCTLLDQAEASQGKATEAALQEVMRKAHANLTLLEAFANQLRGRELQKPAPATED